uniref:Uncharacterized protein n=1 Tax=Arundo donax TaxID=35708 RepID=A0A0A8ZQF0_ARUDO
MGEPLELQKLQELRMYFAAEVCNSRKGAISAFGCLVLSISSSNTNTYTKILVLENDMPFSPFLSVNKTTSITVVPFKPVSSISKSKCIFFALTYF